MNSCDTCKRPLTVGMALQDPRVGKAPEYARVRILNDIGCILYWHNGDLRALNPSGHDAIITAGALGNVLHLPACIVSASEDVTSQDWEESLQRYRNCRDRLEAERDGLLAERHAVCDALMIDNDSDAENPAGVAMRIVAERDAALAQVQAMKSLMFVLNQWREFARDIDQKLLSGNDHALITAIDRTFLICNISFHIIRAKDPIS